MTIVVAKLEKFSPTTTESVLVAIYEIKNRLEMICGRYMKEEGEYFSCDIPENWEVVIDAGRIGWFRVAPTFHKLYKAKVISGVKDRLRIGRNIIGFENLEIKERY